MSKRNFYSSLLVLAFFGFFFAYSMRLDESASYWPQLICVVGGVLSVLNAMIYGLQWKKEGGQVALFPLNMQQIKRGAILLGVAAVWVLCISKVGYLVSSVLATGVLVLVFEPVKDKKHFIRDIVVTIIFSVVIYQLFALLGVHFPKGLLM